MGTQGLPLSDIVDVIVQVSPQLPSPPTFNTGLILGSSPRIPSWGGSNPRIREYSLLSQMLSDGFQTSDPEYISAELYFSQNQPPQSVYVGRLDASGTVITGASIAAAGTGYNDGDILAIAGGTAGQVLVTGVSGGAVTAISIIQGGTGYSAGTEATSDTTGTGSGCTVTITVGSESHVQAIGYCRQITTAWYGLFCCDGTANTDAVILAIAAFIEPLLPPMRYFATTSDAAVVNNQVNNLGAQLQALNYSRTTLDWATTQSGLAPNNIYSGAAVLGLIMGQNTGLANSYAVAMFKTIVGIIFDPITQTQANNLDSLYVNHYSNFQNSYTIFLKGFNCDGSYIDQITQRDILAADIQFTTMNLLVGSPAIPLTDQGMAILTHGVAQAADRAVARGYIAPGVWEGVTILGLTADTSLPTGYLAQAAKVSTLSAAQRAARQAPPIYLAIIEADAVQSITIGVYVQ